MNKDVDVMFRLIWNTNGWRAPSGGFQEAQYTFGSESGFGHEEWNFQTNDAVDGYVYGYVYPRPAKLLKEKSRFRTVFYAINPDKEWLLVGEYSETEMADDKDAAKVDQFFENNGIYDERTEQLIPITSGLTDFRGHDFTKLSLSKRRDIIRNHLKKTVQNGHYKLKCPISKVEPYPGGIPIEPPFLDELHARGTQYIRPFYPSDAVRITSPVESDAAKRDVRLEEGPYWRLSPAKRQKIWKQHNKLSNDFADWLKNQRYIKVEQEKNQVDTEFNAGNILCRAELKVCGEGKPLWSIREAVGQLLQYNLYGNRKSADYWFIVLDEEPNEWDFDFIETLRDTYSLPIWLGWQEGDKFELEMMP